MLTNADQSAVHNTRSAEARLRIGDRARFPLYTQALGRDPREPQCEPYRHTFELVAFCGQRLRHCVIVRRLADGFTKTIAARWFLFYQLD